MKKSTLCKVKKNGGNRNKETRRHEMTASYTQQAKASHSKIGVYIQSMEMVQSPQKEGEEPW